MSSVTITDHEIRYKLTEPPETATNEDSDGKQESFISFFGSDMNTKIGELKTYVNVFNYSIEQNFGIKNLMCLIKRDFHVKDLMQVEVALENASSSNIELVIRYKKCKTPELSEGAQAVKGPDYNFYGGFFNRDSGLLYVSTTATPEFVPFIDAVGYTSALFSGIRSLIIHHDITQDGYVADSTEFNKALADRLFQHLKIASVKGSSRLIDSAVDIEDIIKSIHSHASYDTSRTITASVLSNYNFATDSVTFEDDLKDEFCSGLFAIFEQIMLFSKILGFIKENSANMQVISDNGNDSGTYFNTMIDSLESFIKFFETRNNSSNDVVNDSMVELFDYMSIDRTYIAQFVNPACKRIFGSKYRPDSQVVDVFSIDNDDHAVEQVDKFTANYEIAKYMSVILSSNIAQNKTAQYLTEQLFSLDDYHDKDGNPVPDDSPDVYTWCSNSEPKFVDELTKDKIISFLGIINVIDLLTGYEKDVLDVNKVFNDETDPKQALASIKQAEDILQGLAGMMKDIGINVNDGVVARSNSPLEKTHPNHDKPHKRGIEEFDLRKFKSTLMNKEFLGRLLKIIKCK